jgi:hypothetical protein
MKTSLLVMLGAALVAAACGTSASDATDTSLTAGTDTSLTAGAAAPGAATPAAAARPATPSGSDYRMVTIPAGTELSLSLTSSVDSGTSQVEDAVTAELSRAISIDGREVLPAGSSFAGNVTAVDDSGHVRGRASIAMDFTSVRTAGTQYDVRAEPYSQLAPATKSEDATKVGIGAGAGAIIGGLLGGGDGAAKGAAIGGASGAGVVLATRGEEVRLGPGAAVTTRLTAPLTVRVRL